MPEIPTLQDLADRLGTTRATVSRALRGSPEIGAEMRERARALAERMGYRANPLVSALMTQVRARRVRRRADAIIAVLEGWPEGSRLPAVFSGWLAGMRARAAELGSRIQVFSLHRDGMTPERMAGILWTRQIHRAVFLPFERSGRELAMPLDRLASVCIGHTLAKPGLHRVSPNHYQLAMEACERLHALGYRRIGLLQTRDIEGRVAHQFSAAFLAWRRMKVGVADIPPCTLETTTRPDDRRLLRRWMERHRPDAVIDDSGFGRSLCMDVAAGAKRAYVTLNWTKENPECAGIDQRPELIGAWAVDLVTSQAYLNDRGVPAVPKLSLADGVWRDGASAPKLG